MAVNKILYNILIDMTEFHIRELIKIHDVDMKTILGDNFISNLKKRDIDGVRLTKVYFTVIRPMLEYKRKSMMVLNNVAK